MSTATWRSETRLLEQVKLSKIVTLSLNEEALDRNFQILTECMKKMTGALGEFSSLKESLQALSHDVGECKGKVNSLIAENSLLKDRLAGAEADIKQTQAALNPEVVLGRIDELNQKCDIAIRNSQSFDMANITLQLDKLQKYVGFGEFGQFVQTTVARGDTLEQQLLHKVESGAFSNFQKQVEMEMQTQQEGLTGLRGQTQQMRHKIGEVEQQTMKAKDEIGQNNSLIEEIKKSKGDDIVKKVTSQFRNEFRAELSELSSKVAKKAGKSDISSLEDKLVDKLDLYFKIKAKGDPEVVHNLARLSEKVESFFKAQASSHSQDCQDSLFAGTRMWYCAACSGNLGKYEGKLDKYKPWSVFPCKELSPQKTGGLGYAHYIQKLQMKKGLLEQTPEKPRGLQTAGGTTAPIERKKEHHHQDEDREAQSSGFREFYSEKKCKPNFAAPEDTRERATSKAFRLKKKEDPNRTARESILQPTPH